MAGRPKKAAGLTRGNVLRIRLTEEERALLDEAARNKGLETSTWARSELVSWARSLLAQEQSGAKRRRPTAAE
jgi:uncharacterized protein (DUF1778 family)